MAVHIGGRGPGHMARAAKSRNVWDTFGSSLAVYHDLQGSTPLFKDFVGTPAAVGDGVALAFDSASWGGRSLSQMVATGTELLGNGAIGIVGTATAATYNTSTGAGSVSRAGSSANQSYVTWTGLSSAGRINAVTITNTGATSLTIYSGAYNGTAWQAVAGGASATVYVPAGSGAITICATSNSTTATFTVSSFKAVPGAHMYQSSAGSQPKLRQNATTGAYYLECDGSDDGMVTPSLDLSATDKVAVFTACRKLSDAATGAYIEHGIPGTNPKPWNVSVPRANTVTGSSLQARDGTNVPEIRGPNSTAPATLVLTAIGDLSAATVATQVQIRTNGSISGNTTSGSVASPTTLGNYPLYYFRRGGASNPFNGYYYGDMIFAGTPTPAQIAWAEAYYNRLSGAY